MKAAAEQHDRKATAWAVGLDMALLAGCAWLALRAFWRPGMPIEADFLLDVYRSFTLDQAWQSRQFFPRLGMELNFGYGGPLFQYYPPLASYLTMVLHWLGLGWAEATKAAFTVALLLAGTGMYVFAGWLFRDRRAALVGGLGYMLAPYLLFCAYERGALAELLALGLLPWLFWAMGRLVKPRTSLRDDGGAWIWPASALVALLMLAHNITALFALPLLALYLGGMAAIEGRARRLAPAAAAGALGLGLSAFYWLPALAERDYAQIERWMLGGDFSAAANLVGLGRLAQRALAFDYWSSWIPALPAVTGILALVGLAGLLARDRQHRALVLLLAGLTLIPLFLMWQASRPLYDAVALLRYVQYPWRLLGLASFTAALLAASIFGLRRLSGAPGWAAAVALVCLILYAGLRGIQPPPEKWPYFGSEQVSLRDHYERGRSGYWWLYNDYQPAGMKEDVAEMAWADTPGADFGLPPVEGTPAIEVVAEGPAHLRLRVRNDVATTLRLPRIFFPGWRAEVDGEPVAVRADGPWGLVTLAVPAGSHEVAARFGETPLRATADVISAACLVIWLVGLARERRMRPLLVGTIAAAGLVAVLSLARHGLGQPARLPAAFAAELEGDIQMLGYDLQRRSYRPGEAIDVRLYWMARRTPADNYRVFLHLVTPDDATRVAQNDEAPLLDSRPTGRWLPGEVVVDHQELQLPDDAPPGTYRLLAGMYRPEDVQNLAVSSAPAVLPGDRLDLGEVEIE
jgi:hypothetical protein